MRAPVTCSRLTCTVHFVILSGACGRCYCTSLYYICACEDSWAHKHTQGYYREQCPGDTTGDAACIACTVGGCGYNEYRPVCDGLFSTADSECKTCSTAPCQDPRQVRPICDGSVDTQDSVCVTCQLTCASGEYIASTGCKVSGYTGVICAKCRTSCGYGERLSGVCDGKARADLTCLPCTNQCGEGEYMATVCAGNTTKVYMKSTCIWLERAFRDRFVCQLPFCLSTAVFSVNCRCVCQLPFCLSTAVVSVNCCCVCQLPFCLSTAVVSVNCRCVCQLPLCLSTAVVSVNCRFVCQLPLCLVCLMLLFAKPHMIFAVADTNIRIHAYLCVYIRIYAYTHTNQHRILRVARLAERRASLVNTWTGRAHTAAVQKTCIAQSALHA